jgi:energy-coupling factor transporter ATP-binding protein EcfA2
MAKKKRTPATAQGNLVSYALHSLGWKAFQDLCATIMREVMGQTFQQFFDSRDGGRDGAFRGVWSSGKRLTLKGAFTVQCKFSAKADKHLSFGDLSDEIEKATILAERGLATNYILMTSMHVTGDEDATIREKLLEIDGIETAHTFGIEWISQVIRENAVLRMLVPRIYGLGDLSLIMDERAVEQAREILSSMGEDLAKFVITDAHRQSVGALQKHRFVLLLGEPAAGKSTIAASLAVAALDNWGHSTFKIRTPDDFVRHSNPNEPGQFFWVDDAFGATQFEHRTASEWNQVFPHMWAAIRRGASVLFTSRDYVYRAARELLKESAFPLLAESQVVIHVDQLTKPEREQILYNHVRMGRQPPAFRTRLKRFLGGVAAHPDFKPEIARRLSDPIFTKALEVSEKGLRDFVERPMEHLKEVIRTLDNGSKAALAVVFMRGGTLPSPIDLTDNEAKAAERMGGSPADIRIALNALNESLVLRIMQDGRHSWRFKHPTVQDAVAEHVADDPEFMDIYLAGTSAEKLLDEIACGKALVEGVRVVVPEDRFGAVLAKIFEVDVSDTVNRRRVVEFLCFRCDVAFVKRYVQCNPEFIDTLQVQGYWANYPDGRLLARLHSFGMLPEKKRLAIVSEIEQIAVEVPDASFLEEPFRSLLHEHEIEEILEVVKNDLFTDLPAVIDTWTDSWCDNADVEPGAFFQPLIDALRAYADEIGILSEVARKCDEAEAQIEALVESLLSDGPDEDPDLWHSSDAARSGSMPIERSVFDDVDQ